MRYEFLSSLNFCQVTDGQTDRQKVTHMSTPCIRTGGLNENDAPRMSRCFAPLTVVIS